ncbi:hypothetical protein [Dyadobacter frigoris]|uniref:Uncharacterized protein n=1 Tax=Dyadobacter frigoris TaxID=2576211 RepID=A0A4U6CNG3_9BACT|nr:hypothetical protein [Dyadobacter frigoris]TKT84891.1 hypothetical protein FDK13_34570 [Dyadobacter frigoris]
MEESNRNVLSWHQALDKGFNPSSYPFETELVPQGEFPATLDFKIWAKKISGISCFFTRPEDQTKFQLTVYRRRSDRQYMLESCDSDIDFSTCPLNENYLIEMAVNGKGNISFKNAALLNSTTLNSTRIIKASAGVE